MALTASDKQGIVTEFAKGERDTGSAEVQIALMTHRIRYLTEHLKQHKHDHSSTRGLLRLVGRRRKLLRYVKTRDADRYQTLIKSLGIRR